MSKFMLTLETEPSQDDLSAINAILSEFNRRAMPDSKFQALTIVVRDGAGYVVGGLRGETYWDWLYVDTLAIRDDIRGQGVGSRLMVMAEQEAIARGCHSAYLDTFSFQALPFYQKQGYEIFGTLDNYPGEQKRYFLRKQLIRQEGNHHG